MSRHIEPRDTKSRGLATSEALSTEGLSTLYEKNQIAVQTRFDGLLFHLSGRRLREMDIAPEIEFQPAKKPTAASDMYNDPLVERGGNSTKAG